MPNNFSEVNTIEPENNNFDGNIQTYFWNNLLDGILQLLKGHFRKRISFEERAYLRSFSSAAVP